LEAPLRAFGKTKTGKRAACCHATHHHISLCLRLAVFPTKLLYAGCVTSCRWRTPVRAAVFCHTPSGAASGRSKLRPSRCERDKARPDAATGPAAGCPPVCQRSTFPLRRNARIIPYRADGRKVCKKEIMTKRMRTHQNNSPPIAIKDFPTGGHFQRTSRPLLAFAPHSPSP